MDYSLKLLTTIFLGMVLVTRPTLATQDGQSPSSIMGFTEDQVGAIFGPPSLPEKASDGSVTWYYDGTSQGTVRIYFANGRVIRMAPDNMVQELQRRVADRRNATPTKAAVELPIPPDLRDRIARSSAIGRQLYVLDKVAAIGTDVFLEHVRDPERKGLAGYVPMQEADDAGKPRASFLVSFFTTETPPRIAYQIRVAPDTRPTFQRFSPPEAATSSLAAFIRARQLAIAAMPASDQPVNPVLIPGEANGEKGILVYLLAGTTQPNVAVFGRHFRALVAENGASVTYMMPLSNTIIETPTRGADGETVAALAVTQILTDFPLETHVFTSLLVKMPVYVTTRHGLWRVDGDKIALFG